MAITTYAELKTAVASWMNRDDLTAIIPDFITLAEERMNRVLRVRQMEVALTATAINASGIVAIPANVVGVKTLWLDGYEHAPLKAQTYEFLLANDNDGLATHWAMQGDGFYFNGTGTVEGVLYRNIPALTLSNTTNWLLTAHPSVYLTGALAEGKLYTDDVEAAKLWAARFDVAMSEVAGSDMRDVLSGPLQARAR